MTGYFKFMRSEATRDLLKDPKALALLALIAYRAKWTAGPSIHKLEQGQAFIGDFHECGLKTQKEYRMAKRRLTRYELVAFHGTNKGTVATLLNTDVFDILGDRRGVQEGNLGASQGQTRGNQGATNEDGRRREKTEKPKAKIRRINIQDYADIKNPDNDPVSLACSLAREYEGPGPGYWRKELRRVGDKPFRVALEEAWGENKTGEIKNIAAILNTKLKRIATG
ncbi:MAG: hypothetical protein A2283_12415 [Lentisphaerae bacterium RIFOXYA12_FULL_48_11]|nr:MAG: hypothetical protein A2283_12415 [Lentisphaerae bacterium RIFOXYA12_FULL_48_11]